jgi:hypothetical protein
VVLAKSEGTQQGDEWTVSTSERVYSAPGAGRAAVYRYNKGGIKWRYSLSNRAGFDRFQLDGAAFYLPQTAEKALRALSIYYKPERVLPE